MEDNYKKISSRIEAEWYPYHEDEWFTHTDICSYFNWREQSTRQLVSRKLYHDSHEVADHKLEKQGKAFRLIDKTIEEIDWDNADPDDVYQLKFPYDMESGIGFSFEENIYIPPKGLVVVAGVSNAGKTTFLLNLLARNMDDFECTYFTSELSAVAIKRRLIPFEHWYELRREGKPKFRLVDRSDNFHDVIKPDGLNFVDYLDVNNEAEYYKIKPYLKRIKRALKRGIAIVALQKRPGSRDAYGGANLRGDTDLYLSLDFGELYVTKAKDWTNENPNDTKYKFNIEYSGAMFTNIQRVYD